MAKHFTVAITDTSLAVGRKQQQIEEEARLDGIYVIRTPVPADTPAPVLTEPTHRQKEAFDLIGAAIPLTLRK